MQYCTLKQNPVWTSSQVPQGGSQLMQEASQTQQTWNTNVIHQYKGPNSRVQQLQTFNVSLSQGHLYRQTPSQNSAGVASSHRSANKKKLSPLLVSMLCDKHLQDDNQTAANQNPSSTIVKNTTPSQHVVSAEWQQSNASSYSQHSGLQQGYYQSSDGVVVGATAAPDPPQQWVHPKTSSTADSFPQQGYYGQNSSPNSTQGYSTGYPANVGIPTNQSVTNNGPTVSPRNTQVLYLPNINLQTNQHSGQLSARGDNSENVSSNLNYYRPPPPHSSSHLFNLPRTSNQIIPSPATVLHSNYDGNVAQPPPLLPERPQSVSPSNMLIPLPQTSLSNNASVGLARAGSGGAQSVHVSPPSNAIVPEKNPVTSSSNGSQPLQPSKSVSSQRAPKENLIAQIRRWLEDLAEKHTQKMSSKAVAVVQPLSQEIGSISTNTTSGDSLITPEKGQLLPTGIKNGCVYQSVDVGLDTEHPNTKRSNKAVPNTNTNSANVGLEQQQSEVSHRKSPQCLPRGRKKANTTPSPAPAAGLSALPTTTWTAAALNDVIQETQKSQAIPADSQSGLPGKFQRPVEEVVHQNINNSHKCILPKFLLYVKLFCDRHVSPDTVVLSQVKEGFEEQLKHYHVLGDEAYSEQPFKSLWLNVNEKLDDIDKEFGFPWTLRRHFYVDESDSQKDENNQNNFSKATIKEVPEEIQPVVKDQPSSVQSPPTPTAPDSAGEDSTDPNYSFKIQVLTPEEEIQPVSEVVKDQPSSVQSLPTPTAPDSAGEDSTDPNYSFKIQVLTPEEAKAFYEEVQNDHRSTGGQKETAEIDHLKTDPPTDATSTGSEAENLPVDPIDHICCHGKFMGINLGLNTLSVKCQCNKKQEECKSTDEGSTDKGLDSDLEIQENVVEDECELSEELPTELCQIIDLTEDDKPDPAVIEEPITVEDLLDTDTPSSAEDDEHSNGCGSFEEIPGFVIKLSESEEESSAEEGISSQTAPSTSSDDRTNQAEPLMLLQTPEEDDGGEQTSSKSNDEPVCEQMKNPPNIGPKTICKKLTESRFRNVMSKRKQRSLCTFSSSLKEVQGSTTENKSVKLVLFGSANQEKCRSPAIKIGHHSSPTSASAGAQEPPQVVSVNVESSQKNLEEATYSRKPSVKQLIYEKWSKSFPSCYRNKMKRQRSFSASVPESPKNKRQSSSERRDSDGKGKVSLRRKRTKSLPNAAVGVQEAKRRRYRVSLGQTAQQDERNTDHEVDRPMPLQENIVLKFSMLPSTFTFKDGSNVGTGGNNGVSGQTESVNNKQNPRDVVKTIKSNKERWCHSPIQHSEPPKIPKNSNLFEEYQKKYQEKNQTLTNK